MPNPDSAQTILTERRRLWPSGLRPPKADAMLVIFLPNVRYLTGYTGSNGMLLLSASGDATFFTDPRYQIQAAAEVSCHIKVSKGPLLPDVVRARRTERRSAGSDLKDPGSDMSSTSF